MTSRRASFRSAWSTSGNPETDMAGRRGRTAQQARRGSVPAAIAVMTKVRTAPDRPQVRPFLAPICCRAKAPFPDVPGHLIQTVSVWFMRLHGSCTEIGQIPLGCRKPSPENIAIDLSVPGQIVTPRVSASFKPAPRGKFPFFFGRQARSRPSAIGHRIMPVHMRHRVILGHRFLRPRPMRRAPARPLDLPPPRRFICGRMILG